MPTHCFWTKVFTLYCLLHVNLRNILMKKPLHSLMSSSSVSYSMWFVLSIVCQHIQHSTSLHRMIFLLHCHSPSPSCHIVRQGKSYTAFSLQVSRESVLVQMPHLARYTEEGWNYSMARRFYKGCRRMGDTIDVLLPWNASSLSALDRRCVSVSSKTIIGFGSPRKLCLNPSQSTLPNHAAAI
jgi:hypothetical protein